MNVLSLFDGISCGQLALQRSGIKYENYLSSEIDKYAINVTMKNFPNTIQLGSVTEVKAENLPKIDLLIGGSPCFIAGTKVITKNQIKNIENVNVGDYVLTHTNTFKKVLRTGGKYSDTILLKAQGMKPTIVTHEHPYYVRTMKRIWNHNTKKSERFFSEPYWKPACELTTTDFVGIPRLNMSLNTYNLTKEECWIIGRYIADGHTRKDYRTKDGRPNDRQWQLILTVGSSKLNDFANNVNTLHYSSYKHTKSTNRIVFSNKRLVQIVEAECGCRAVNKHISMNLLNLPIDLLKSLLNGYLCGDGNIRKNGSLRAGSISEELILNLNLAILKVYGVNSSYEYSKKALTYVIEGRRVNQNNIFTTSFRLNMKPKSVATLIDDIMWVPIKDISSSGYYNYVYNLEVDVDNSYTANNIIVHNCQGFSFSGKQLNFNDPRSKLFFEYVRILKECNPTYFLLENVVMKKEFETVITNTLGVDPIMINSSLVSAQNRKRLYWTNIPNVTQPEDKGITWGNVRERGVNGESYYYTEKAMQWLARSSRKREKVLTVHQDTDKMQMLEASHCKKYSNQRFFGIADLPTNEQAIASMRGRFLVDGKRQDGKMSIAGLGKQYVEFRYDGKSNCLSTVGKDNIVVPFTLPNRIPVDEFFFRYITPLECERLQTVPDGYTDSCSSTQRYRQLGNGWTVDVISHIFSFIQ